MTRISRFQFNSSRTTLTLLICIIAFGMVRAFNTVFLSRFSVMDSTPQLRELVKSSFDIKHMVYVPTAAYCLDPRSTRPLGEQRRRARYDAKNKAKVLSESFSNCSFSLLELDSVDMSCEIIKLKMSEASLIYVDGGNTFYLQKHIIQSAFWAGIQPFLDNGGLYIGASAGAIVAGKSIRTAEWKGWDDPTITGEDFEWTEERMTGRGLRDYSVFMHYDEDRHKSLVEEKSKKLDHAVRLISDDIALIHFNFDQILIINGETSD